MNLKLIEFALVSVSARKMKYIFIIAMFSMLVFLCSSVFYITSSLKKETGYAVSNMPDIIVQQRTAGIKQLINVNKMDKILTLPGVDYAEPRIWGLYRFEYLRSNLTIVGVDPYAENRLTLFSSVTKGRQRDVLLSHNSMIVGFKLAKLLKQIYNSYAYSFQTPGGDLLNMSVGATFRPQSQMISTDTVLMNTEEASEILGIPHEKATDIAVYVPNPDEIQTVAMKISSFFPDCVCITKLQMRAAYQNMFDYKKGIFLLLFTTCLFTFIIIAFDKLSGLGMEEQKEIAVLKALGWKVSDIMKVKIYESAAVSAVSFILGTIMSLTYVFIFNAPVLKNIFLGYAYLKPDFNLAFNINSAPVINIFMITVPVYFAAVLIPTWKSAVTDASESIR